MKRIAHNRRPANYSNINNDPIALRRFITSTTSRQRLRILRRLYDHAITRMTDGLDEIYEDIRAWGAPGECFTGIMRTREHDFMDTIEKWFRALFPTPQTADAEVYGAYFMSLMRSRVWYLKPPRHNVYSDLIAHLKFNELIEFVVEAEDVVCVERSHMRKVRELFDAVAALREQLHEIRLDQIQNAKY